MNKSTYQSDLIEIKCDDSSSTSQNTTSIASTTSNLAPYISRRRRHRRRVLLKNGACNVLACKSGSRRAYFFQDFFETLISASVTLNFSVFCIVLLSTWMAFAVLWWLICYTHGDFEPEHLVNGSDWKPCLHATTDFMSCFMFSIETQHTVGYGVKAPTDECPEAIFLNVVQCTIGVIIQGLITGIIFAKMTLPKKRSETLLFSRNACVSIHNKHLCLSFRLGDARKGPILDPTLQVILLRTERTREGELLRQTQRLLKVFVDGCEDIGNGGLLLIWPVVVRHRIDESSPLFDLGPEMLKRDCFEVVVVLEGVIQCTGQSTQARTSYLATEVLWGRKFREILEDDEGFMGKKVNFGRFHEMEAVETPMVSGRDLAKSGGKGLKTVEVG